MSLEAITKIREVEDNMEQSKAEAKAQAQKLLAKLSGRGASCCSRAGRAPLRRRPPP